MFLDNFYKEKYIIFLDIEFQNFEIKGKQYYYILEIGVIIFERNIEKPILIDHINFPILKLPNIRLINIDYTNVSEETEKLMQENQNKLIIKPNIDDIKSKEKLIRFIPGKMKKIIKEILKTNDLELLEKNKDKIEKDAKNAIFQFYKNRLPNEYKNIIDNQIKLYSNDYDVNKRMVNPANYLKKLNNYLNDGILIHKENTDIEAIKNTSKYYNIDVSIKNKFDIAIFNQKLSKIISPNLHNSYLYLYDKYITQNNELLIYHNTIIDLVNKKMRKFEAHNPLVDAFMTIFVFILLKN